MARAQLKTLLLDANGVPVWQTVLSDTVLRGVLDWKEESDIPALIKSTAVGGYLKRKFDPRYQRLSYVLDWREAFLNHPKLDVTLCNVNNLVDLRKSLKGLHDFDLIVVMHSAAGDNMQLISRLANRLRKRKGLLVTFIGNEYDLMKEKFSFVQSAEVDIVCSMLPIQSADWVYGNLGRIKIHPMPQALNEKIYQPAEAPNREIDLGFIGSRYPLFVGDTERNRLLDFIDRWDAPDGYRVELNFNNVPRQEWADFLRKSKVVLGCESGTYYLDREGKILARTKEFFDRNPNASFEEMVQQCLTQDLPDYVSGKHMTSRHFEAMGSGTCQLLLEGDYNDIIQADVHYVELKKDYSNLGEAISQLRDSSRRKEIADNAYQLALDGHTYRHRVDSLLEIL